tara:strand:- start:160 stop:531 length:372 start_codon:yes stop_codon:yes gene_type:complete
MSMVNKWYPWFEGHAPRAALFSIGTNPPDSPNQAKSIAQIGGPVRQSAHPQHQNNPRAWACNDYQRAYTTRPGSNWTSIGPIFPMSYLSPETGEAPGHYRFSPATLLFAKALFARFGSRDATP